MFRDVIDYVFAGCSDPFEYMTVFLLLYLLFDSFFLLLGKFIGRR